MELLKFMTAFIPNVFLIFSFKHLNSQAAVMLAPTGITHRGACVGKSLEFTCDITGMLLEWSFPIVVEGHALRPFSRAITAEGPAEAQAFQLMDNAATYNFIRTSAEGSPVSSRLLINAVGNSHNSTEITCKDVSSQPEEMASTTIVVIDSQIQDLTQMKILADAEFQIDGIKVTLEWISQENPPYSYHIEVDPQIIVTCGNSSAIICMLMLSYNIPYNLSVLAGNLCSEDNLTIFNQKFNYIKCDVPSANTISDNTLTILGYNESIAVIGSNITFTCIPGMEPKNATCMESGEWKPHLNCTRMITESDVSIQNSAKTSSDTLTVLASTFGTIVFIVLIIVATLVLFVAYSAKRTRSKVSSERKSHYKFVSASAGTCPTDNHQSNTESKNNIVYADIGPSSFNQHLRQQLHTPAIDNDAVEYAQIKHNSQHVQTPSLKNEPKPTEFISDSPDLNVNLDNLLIQLRPQVTPMWYKFGEAAEIDKEVLDNFAKQCSPEDCIMEVLDYWLRKCIKQPTWTDVAKILKIIHLSQLALQIENVYITGKLPVEVDMNWIQQPHVENNGADPSDIGLVAVSTDSKSTPPRIPSKMNHSKSAVSNAVPALPPKPKAY